MTLRACADLTAAQWFTASDTPWDRLATFGPAGFPAYARLRFLPDPPGPGFSESDAGLAQDGPPESMVIAATLRVLAAHTTTPDRADCALWDGWGEARDLPTFAAPHRAYHLFEGPLADVGDWDDDGHPTGVLGSWNHVPAFVWPADHAWCLARDVDPHWAGIGATPQALQALLDDPGLDVVLADPTQRQPAYSS